VEKVIQEWRVIETDDGYRIELKGDKERLRDWVQQMHFARRPRWPRHWRRYHARAPWPISCEPEQQAEAESTKA
jgi:hypothetical protein